MDQISRNLGGVVAIGIGVGAALASSMGSIGYGLGLAVVVGAVLTARGIKALRA
jgi:hypothetical protein